MQSPDAKLTDPLFQHLHQLDIPLRNKRDGRSLPPRTGSPTDPVNVVLRHTRHLPVDDDGDLGDVETARADVCRDEERDGLAAELGERFKALGLREVRVERGARDRGGELREERVEKCGGAAVRDEEDRLRQDGPGLFGFVALLRRTRALARGFGRRGGV